MPTIINYKICDQAPVCGGVEVCPVGAFYYNKKTKRIEVDNTKCISCGACAKTCPIGAIAVVKTQKEYEELKREIENDPRRAEDLFVDRFGADIINKKCIIKPEKLEEKVLNEKKCLIELFDLDQAKCLLKSIPYHEIVKATDYKKYYRCNVGDDKAILKKYKIKQLPAFLVCQNGKFKVVAGYLEEGEKESLFAKINSIKF